jgi:hypothetical protein
VIFFIVLASVLIHGLNLGPAATWLKEGEYKALGGMRSVAFGVELDKKLMYTITIHLGNLAKWPFRLILSLLWKILSWQYQPGLR